MGWIQDSDGFWVANDGTSISDIANCVSPEGEIYHIQNLGRIMAHCSEMQKSGKGWSKTRTMKRLASVPLLEFLKHPRIAEMETNNEVEAYIRKYLPQYSTAEDSRGVASANVVVK
jgi:hypothetical protein